MLHNVIIIDLFEEKLIHLNHIYSTYFLDSLFKLTYVYYKHHNVNQSHKNIYVSNLIPWLDGNWKNIEYSSTKFCKDVLCKCLDRENWKRKIGEVCLELGGAIICRVSVTIIYPYTESKRNASKRYKQVMVINKLYFINK